MASYSAAGDFVKMQKTNDNRRIHIVMKEPKNIRGKAGGGYKEIWLMV